MIIADAGSSSTKWIEIASKKTWKTDGFNPNYHRHEPFAETLNSLYEDQSFRTHADIIIYYGTGCYREKSKVMVRTLLSQTFKDSTIEVNSDLLGAARACAADEDAYIAILGTGSSFCKYENGALELYPSLGYPFGEECSGYDIARRILERYDQGLFSADIRSEIKKALGTKPYGSLTEVLNLPKSNTQLASLFQELDNILENSEIEFLIDQAIEDFYQFQLRPMDIDVHLPLHLVGTVASRLSEPLKDFFEKRGMKLGNITRDPIPDLLQYHMRHNYEKI